MDAAAFAVVIAAVAARIFPWPALLIALALPQAIQQVRAVLRETEAKQLHLVWLSGVKLHMQFGVLLIVGLLAGAALHI